MLGFGGGELGGDGGRVGRDEAVLLHLELGLLGLGVEAGGLGSC